MERNVVDADDAVGNGATFNGSGADELFVGRSAADTAAGTGSVAQVGEEFFGQGGSDVFDGRGGNDSFFVDGNDSVIAAADDGRAASIFGFNNGGNTVDFSDFGAQSFDDLTIVQQNFGTQVSAEGSQVINLRNVDAGDIDANDFIFANDDGGQNNADVVVEAPEVEEVVAAPEIEIEEQAADVEEVAAAPEIEAEVEEQAEEVEEVAAAPEVQQPQSTPSNLNVVDASGDVGGFQRVAGTDGDDLILTSAQSASLVDAGAGDDTIVVQGADGFNTDFVDTGAGRDTVVLSDDTEFVTFSRGDFDTDQDVIDLSQVSGVGSFEELTANLRDDLVAANEVSGALEIETGNGPTITFIDPDDAADLSEDNFVFAGDDDAFVG